MTEPSTFEATMAAAAPMGTEREASWVRDRALSIRRSALWAAYGDALGWISELTTPTGLKKRTAGEALDQPMAWKRRIGGRAGVVASLPKGCYSDDSQLRLATARAVRADGFDVEAFANVELPIWLSYELGGGKSTKAAAAKLARPQTPWFANTFTGWTNSGGNGAAMRIQPHVWAARDLQDTRGYLIDIVRNAVCTHSHPVGIMGAVVHALALAQAFEGSRPPTAKDMLAKLDVAASVPDLLRDDTELGSFWQPAFERESGAFKHLWRQALEDCGDAIRTAGDATKHASASKYRAIIEALRLREPSRRGSGVLTAVAALGLTWCEEKPSQAMRVAANEIGTDTDTIATMAGALLGAIADADPPVEVLDAALFRSEAERLARIAKGEHVDGHRYPDLLHWTAPNSRAEALTCFDDGRLQVRGLGPAKAIEDPIRSADGRFMWQWVALETGQTLLIKRRASLSASPDDHRERRLAKVESPARQGQTSRHCADRHQPKRSKRQRPFDIGNALAYVRAHKADDRHIGLALRRAMRKGNEGERAAFLAELINILRSDDTPD